MQISDGGNHLPVFYAAVLGSAASAAEIVITGVAHRQRGMRIQRRFIPRAIVVRLQVM